MILTSINMPFVLFSAVLILILSFVLIYAWTAEKKKVYKIALDIHGVSDTAPEFFSMLSQLLVLADCEVHILTGITWSKEVVKQLEDFGIKYTHSFSIVDYHKAKGTAIAYKDPSNPIIDAELWNRTKADYCREHGIDMCIDDSPIYGDHFTTPYIQVIVKKFPIKK